MAINRYQEPTQADADIIATQSTPLGGLMEPLEGQPEIVPEQDAEYDVAMGGVLRRLRPVPKKVDDLRQQAEEVPPEEPPAFQPVPGYDAAEELRRAQDKFDRGKLTQDQFDRQKAKIADRATPRVSGVEERMRLKTLLEEERGSGSFAATINPEFRTRLNLPDEAEADQVVRDYFERIDSKGEPDLFGHRVAEQTLDDFNAGRINSSDDIIDLIATMAQQYSGTLNQQKRGVVRHAAQRHVADLIGASEGRTEKLFEAIMARKVGGVIQMEGVGTTEVMLAARNLMVTLVERTDVMAHRIARGEATPKDLLDFRKQMMVTRGVMAQVKGSQTEIARALGGMRNRSSGSQRFLSGAELEAYDARVVDDLLEESGGEKTVKMMAEAWLKLPTMEQRAQFAASMDKNALARGFDGLYEAWINALLSNPVSQTRNIVGNGLMLFLKVGERSFAGRVAGPVQRAFGAEATVMPGEDVALIYGLIQSFGEARKAAGRAFVDNNPVGFGTGKAEIRPNAFSAEAMNVHGYMGNFINVMGHALTLGRGPTRALAAGDSFFKVLAARADTYATAYRAAEAEGLLRDKSPAGIEKASDFMAEWIANPPASALDSAEKLARVVTFTQQLGNSGSGLAKMIRNGGYGIPRWFIPFFVTPVNIAETIVKHTPLQAVTKGWRADMLGKNGAEAQARAGYQMAMGWGTTLAVCKLAAEGYITGSMPGNKTTRDAWSAQGIRPFTYYPNGMQSGETGYSYAGIEPLSGMFGMAVDTCQITGMMGGEAYWKNHDARDTMGAVMWAFGKNLLSKTYAEGAHKLLEAISGDARDFERAINQLTKSIVPRILAAANRNGVPFLFGGNRMRMDASQYDNYAEQLLRNLQAQTPVVSDAVTPHVDWMTGLQTPYESSGDTAFHKFLDWLNPTYAVIYQRERPYASEVTNPSGMDKGLDPYPVIEEIERLSADADQALELTLRPSWYNGHVDYRGHRIYLSDPWMRHAFKSHAGREAIKFLADEMQYGWEDSPRLEKMQKIRDAYTRGGREAIQMLEDDPKYERLLEMWLDEAQASQEERREVQ